MDLESFERVDMRRARKEPTVASQRRAIRRRLDHEDHASRLQEFLAHRGITLPHSNVAGHTQTHTAGSAGRSSGASAGQSTSDVGNDVISRRSCNEVCIYVILSSISHFRAPYLTFVGK